MEERRGVLWFSGASRRASGKHGRLGSGGDEKGRKDEERKLIARDAEVGEYC